MGNVNIKKRGSVYQYEFEVPKITSKRRRITKSGFKTKREAMEAGLIAQHNFFFTGTKKEENTTTITSNTNKNDTTIANKVLPNTGYIPVIIFLIISFAIVGMFVYIRYKNIDK